MNTTTNSVTGGQVDTAVQADQIDQVHVQTVTGPQFNSTNMSVQYIDKANTSGDIVMNVKNRR